MAVAPDQFIAALRPPGSGRVVGEGLRVLLRPGVEHGRVESPGGLYAFAVREKCGIAEHGIEQQPLVAVG